MKQALVKLVTGMAYTRDSWVDQARNRMRGALGEYAKLRFAQIMEEDFDYNWEPEVKRLIKKIEELFNSETKTRTQFDRIKAFQEAYMEASSAQDQVVSAKNKFEDKYLTNKKQVNLFLKRYRAHFEEFDSENLLADMLATYLPQIAKRIRVR